MKKTILFLTMAFITFLGAKAQTWTASEVGAGDFYLYNVGAGKFLNGGNSWGTQASLNYVGIETTLTATGDYYFIETTKCYSGKALEYNASGTAFVDGLTTATNDKAKWAFEAVAGQENTYLIKSVNTESGNRYLTWSGTGTALVCNSTDKPTTSNGYWKLVSKADLIADMTANATSSNGIDASFCIADPEFNRGAIRGWTGDPALKNLEKSVDQNWAAEKWNCTYDVYQVISGVPNGRYKLSCYGLYRAGDNHNDATTQNAMIYANDETAFIQNSNTNAPAESGNGCDVLVNGHYVPNTQVNAALAIGAGLYGGNEVTVDVTDGNLRIGVKKTVALKNDWTIFDKFSLTFYGTNIANEAVALPNTALEAGSWYYFDLPSDSEYDLTLTTLSDIVYTTDGATLMENEESVTTNFSGISEISLSAGRYYIKSSSAQTFSVVAHTKSYSVGSVTAQSIAEGEYLKGLTTIVLTYGDATTNDAEASLAVIGSATAKLKKNGSDVATGTLTANNAAKTLTATFSAVDLTINANDYSIVIPAGAFGYEGESENAEVTINFNTPLIADGTFYLRNKSTGAYFAIGSSYGTKAISNSLGHIVGLEAQSDGTYYFDSNIYNTNNNASMHYLQGNNDLYCDQAAYKWTMASDGEYYTFQGDGSKYLTAGASGANLSLSTSTGDDTKWALVTAEEWNAAQVATLTTATAAAPVDASFYIPAANFSRGDNLENAKWNGSPSCNGLDTNWNGEKFNAGLFDVYQELTGLKPGTYKLTVDGFYRNGTTDDQNAILYANGVEVYLKNIRSTQIGEQTGGFTTANGDYYVPNNQTDAAKCFNAGYYDNELTFTVGSAGTLRVGVKKTVTEKDDWACFDNFQLQYYGVVLNESTDFSETEDIDNVNVTVNRAMTANVWNTLVVPFNMDKPDGWTVKEPTAFDGSTITFSDASSIEAGKPYIVKPEEAVSSFSATDVTLKKDLDPTTVGTLTMTGTYTAGTVAEGNYIVGIKDGASALYLVNSTVNIKPFRAYFSVSSGVKANIINFNFDDETSIGSIENETMRNGENEKAIYDLSGRRVSVPSVSSERSVLPKGVYIVNGKKILVK